MQFFDLITGDGLSVGEKVRKYRKWSNMTQDELAARAEVSRSTIARLESGDVIPDIDVMIRISNEIDMPSNLILKLKEGNWYDSQS